MKKYGKALVVMFSTVGASSIATAKAFAQSDPDSWLNKFEGQGPQGENLITFIVNLINWIVGAVALIAVVMLIWNGVQYITAGGDEGKVEKATKGITNAIIGLVICFIAVLIVRFVIDRVTSTPAQ